MANLQYSLTREGIFCLQTELRAKEKKILERIQKMEKELQYNRYFQGLLSTKDNQQLR